jgi:hypothetical protein
MSKAGAKIEELKKENSSLKKKIGVIAILTVIFGGSGVFGFYKWLDSERELTATQIRQNTLQSEIAKNEAMNKNFDLQISNLENLINKKGLELEELRKAKESLALIRKNKSKDTKDFGILIRNLSEEIKY